MTAWDMVSIAIFDLTFNVAFYLLLGGGLMAGLLFLVWVTKQVVSHMETRANRTFANGEKEECLWRFCRGDWEKSRQE